MLDNLSKYVYEVYRSKSVSVAAKKLFVSQPALSISIKKAEEELGCPIFNRKTNPFTLTAEGKVYIDAIEKVLKIEQETKETIGDISDLKSGTLRIGTSTHLSFYAIPKICSAFSSKFPLIDISVIPVDSDALRSLLSKNNADIIFTTTDNRTDKFNTTVLFDERFVVVMPKVFLTNEELMPYALTYNDIVSRNYPRDKAIADTSLFSGIEFVYNPPNTNIFKKRKSIFGKSKTEEHITSSSGRFQLNYNLMKAGFGALFCTDAAIATMPENDQCSYFALEDIVAKQSFCISYIETDNLLSQKIIHEFINTAKDLFCTDNPLKILFE